MGSCSGNLLLSKALKIVLISSVVFCNCLINDMQYAISEVLSHVTF